MTGSQLNGFDLVIEFSEQAYKDILSGVFDSGTFLCDLFNGLITRLGLPPSPCPSIFTADISFDVPTDIPSLPAGTSDVVDVRIALGEGGSVGSLRFVAKIDVDRTTIGSGQIDLVRVNLSPSGLLFTNVRLGPFNNTNGALTGALNSIGMIPLLPIPVQRGSTSPTAIVRADNHIIDDRSPGDLDASAILLTFGGGSPGNAGGFTASVVPAGNTGAIGISFDWLGRIIRPQLASALGTPESSFDAPCRLNRSIPLPGDHNPRLTALELRLGDGDVINISATVAASDTGWSATGRVSGSIEMKIQDGRLIIKSNIDDPEIDVDLDWWVYLVGAVIGAIIGGIIAGVIGAIVGAILVPLILWIVEQQLDGLINDVAHRIADVLRQLNLNVDVEAVGLNILFQEVHIDDIVIGSDIVVKTEAPIKSEGVITVQNGQWFDLDSGSVGDSTLASADMALEVVESASAGSVRTLLPGRRQLRTLCCSRLARTGKSTFDIPRYALYGLDYNSPSSIPDAEFAVAVNLLPPIPWLTVPTLYFPTMMVYAVETSEQRFSVIQVVEVTENLVKIRYRTFEKPIPRVRIVGEFKLEEEGVVGGGVRPGLVAGIVGVDIAPEKAQFVPAALTAQQQQQASSAAAAMKMAAATTTTTTAAARLPSCDDRPKLDTSSPGTWQVPVLWRRAKVGRFRAAVENLHAAKYQWSINRTDLSSSIGSVNLGGVTVRYTIEEGGDKITLKPETNEKFYFELGVKVFAEEQDGSSVATSRCIEVAGTSRVVKAAPVTWAIYQEAFGSAFGSLEVAPQAVMSPQMRYIKNMEQDGNNLSLYCVVECICTYIQTYTHRPVHWNVRTWSINCQAGGQGEGGDCMVAMLPFLIFFLLHGFE